ncbi:MAG: permease-like cell division protein FtsX, partial [Patescibacteria group bacterium]
TISFKTKLKRVIKTGFINFFRSGYISLASVLIMVITLSVIASVIFLGAILNTTLTELKNKVDVNVYFLTTAPESDILFLKEKLLTLPEVSNVEYLSREVALENFKKRHENDQITLQALEELGDNPLGAALNIKAKEPSEYQGIAEFLGQENILSRDGKQIIDKVNYLQNKVAIDRLSRIIASSEKLGLVITIVLITISLVITLNTIRLAIYISRDEISVMQLVGASKNYIRGPFVITGVMYGLVAGLLTLILFLPVTYWLGGVTANFFIGLNIFDYYTENIFQIFFIVMLSGVAIGAASSFIAVRRYLKL